MGGRLANARNRRFVLQTATPAGEGFPAGKRGRRPIVPIFPRSILTKNRIPNVVYDRNHLAKRKMLHARMRTLLNESLPPHFNDEPALSPPQTIPRSPRIFSQNAVLSSSEPNLTEVGVDGAVIATPGARANSANNAPERGLADSQSEVEQFQGYPAL